MKILKQITTISLSIICHLNLLAQTASDIEIIKEINPNPFYAMDHFTNMGDYIFFTANDGINGQELWRSDGTTAGTYMVKDINNEPNTGSFPSELKNINGILYFVANDGTFGYELWRSDGTDLGTYMVKDISIGIANSIIRSITAFNNKIYFYTSAVNNFKLWETLGTEATTIQIYNQNTLFSKTEREFVVFDNKLFFLNNSVVSLQYITPTNNFPTTVPISCGDNANAQILGIANNKLFVKANSTGCAGNQSGGNELYAISVGTPSLDLVKDLNGTSSAGILEAYSLNNNLYFTAQETGTGTELFKTDGTTAGTTIVKNIASGNTGSFPQNLSSFNGILYFNADFPGIGNAVWRSDGTVAGTYLFKDLNPSISSDYIFNFFDIGNIALFSGYTSPTTGLFTTNGTAQGTFQLGNLDYVDKITLTANTTFFTARDGNSSYRLYKLKYCETYRMTGVNASSTQPIAEQYYRQDGLCNKLICSAVPSSNPNAISGNATAKVFFLTIMQIF
jgi:ELWxxDGT repeat protein